MCPVPITWDRGFKSTIDPHERIRTRVDSLPALPNGSSRGGLTVLRGHEAAANSGPVMALAA